MNDEIREILENVKKCCDITKEQSFTVYQRQDILKLLDYITNLQKENERLKVKCNNSTSHQINYKYFKTLYSKASKDIVIDDLVYKCEDIQKLIETNEKMDIEKNDYKSRVEKAVEYIKTKGLKEEEWQNNFCIKATATYTREEIFDLLNILQNGSDASVKD